MKKYLALLMAGVLAFSFISCDTNIQDTSSEEISSTISEETSSEEPKTPVTSINRDYTRPEGATGTLVQYPTYPKELPRNYDYDVYVSNGVETIQLPVYNASRHKNAYHSSAGTDSYRRFCEFGFDGEITVSVKVKSAMSNYVILPTSRGIKSTYKDGVITFKLDKPQNVAIRLNNDQNTILSIFAEELETDYPREGDPFVIYFKAGLNNISKLSDTSFYLNHNGEFVIPVGYKVYLEPGALVTTRLKSEMGNMGVKIYGRGSFIDSRLDRVDNGEISNMLYMVANSDVTIKDVKFLDAHCFNLCFTRIDGLLIKNVKLLSSEISSDGITFWGSPGKSNKNVLIEDSYFYVNDNVFVVPSFEENLQIRNCVIGTQHAIIRPSVEVLDFNMENIDIFRMGDFFSSSNKITGVEDPEWNITVKNVYANDAMHMNRFIYVENQQNGRKNVTLENVSLPLPKSSKISISGTTNLNFKCTNVFVGTDKVDNKAASATGAFGINFTCHGKFDKNTAKVDQFAKSVVKANYKGDPTIKIGGYTVDFDGKGALEVEGYIPATNVLKAINYTKNINSYAKEIDGVKMLPLSFFRDTLGMKATTDKNGVTLSAYTKNKNLIKDGGFENIVHTRFISDFSNSLDWTCFNFGELHREEKIVNSGNSSIRLTYKADTTAAHGLAQYITPLIRQYGAGTYTFEIYARVRDENSATKYLKFGLAQSSWYLESDMIRAVAVTPQWQKFTYTLKITDPTSDAYDRAFFFIGADPSQQGVEFFVDDVALYFEK